MVSKKYTSTSSELKLMMIVYFKMKKMTASKHSHD